MRHWDNPVKSDEFFTLVSSGKEYEISAHPPSLQESLEVCNANKKIEF